MIHAGRIKVAQMLPEQRKRIAKFRTLITV